MYTLCVPPSTAIRGRGQKWSDIIGKTVEGNITHHHYLVIDNPANAGEVLRVKTSYNNVGQNGYNPIGHVEYEARNAYVADGAYTILDDVPQLPTWGDLIGQFVAYDSGHVYFVIHDPANNLKIREVRVSVPAHSGVRVGALVAPAAARPKKSTIPSNLRILGALVNQ